MSPKKRAKKADAGKRAVDLQGIVHAFIEQTGPYGTREAVTLCGREILEEGMDDSQDANWEWHIVPRRMVTCVRCLGSHDSKLT